MCSEDVRLNQATGQALKHGDFNFPVIVDMVVCWDSLTYINGSSGEG